MFPKVRPFKCSCERDFVTKFSCFWYSLWRLIVRNEDCLTILLVCRSDGRFVLSWENSCDLVLMNTHTLSASFGILLLLTLYAPRFLCHKLHIHGNCETRSRKSLMTLTTFPAITILRPRRPILRLNKFGF